MPAHAACGVVAALDAIAADALGQIPYVPVALVHLGYAASAFPRPLGAYGFFVPPSEPLHVLGGIFPSELFAGRAPPGHRLLSVRTGGARHPEALSMLDQELLALAHEELTRLLGLCSPAAFVRIVRHERALPQYTLGHMARVAALEASQARHPGLFFHGNAYHNAALPELVRRSDQLAERIAVFVRAKL
jgi:oxygen-dependent protoporphyrinogen oxidase